MDSGQTTQKGTKNYYANQQSHFRLNTSIYNIIKEEEERELFINVSYDLYIFRSIMRLTIVEILTS